MAGLKKGKEQVAEREEGKKLLKVQSGMVSKKLQSVGWTVVAITGGVSHDQKMSHYFEHTLEDAGELTHKVNYPVPDNYNPQNAEELGAMKEVVVIDDSGNKKVTKAIERIVPLLSKEEIEAITEEDKIEPTHFPEDTLKENLDESAEIKRKMDERRLR